MLKIPLPHFQFSNNPPSSLSATRKILDFTWPNRWQNNSRGYRNSNAQFINNWNQKHTDNPATIDFSGEDIGKRILDLANGEFDFLVFDKVSVQKIIKDRGLDLSVVDLPSADSPNNYIIFSNDQKEFKEKFDKALKELYQDGTLEKLSNTYLGGSYLPDQSQLQ